MPGKIQLQKKVFCKLGSVLQTGYDYNAICVYLFVCLYGHLYVCDSVSVSLCVCVLVCLCVSDSVCQCTSVSVCLCVDVPLKSTVLGYLRLSQNYNCVCL
jgi:hypothetical protein